MFSTVIVITLQDIYFNAFRLKELFDTVSTRDVLGFITDIGLYCLIQINFWFTFYHIYIRVSLNSMQKILFL